MTTGKLQNMFSKNTRRKVLGAGVAAVAVVGLSSITDTSAALTVQNSVESYTGSAVELLPPPANGACRTVGSGSFRSAQYYWDDLGSDYQYEIRLGGTYLSGFSRKTLDPVTLALSDYEVVGSEARVNMGEWIPEVGRKTDGDFWVEIRTVNQLGERSDRAFHGKWKSSTYQNYSCNGGEHYDPLETDPANPPALDPQNFARTMMGGVMDNLRLREENLQQESMSDAEDEDFADVTETPESTEAKTTTTEAPEPSKTEAPQVSQTPTPSVTESAPTTMPSPSATETSSVPKPELTGVTTSPSGAVSGGWVGDGQVALVDADGNFLAGGQVDPAATLHWQQGADVLWIVGSDQVYRIMKASDGTWKFYFDSGQNMPELD